MEITSTFKTTLNEFCEVANWMAQKVYGWRNLTNEDLRQIKNKLEALQPIADKYERSFRTSKIMLENELYLNLENASSNLWNSISITLKTEQQSFTKAKLPNDTTKKKDDIQETDQLYLLCCCKLFSASLFAVYDALINTTDTLLRILNCQVNTLKTIVDCLTQSYLSHCCLTNGDVDKALEIKYNSSIVKHDWEELIHIYQDIPQYTLRRVEERTDIWEENQKYKIKRLKLEFFIVNFQLCLKDGDIETAKLYSDKIDINEILGILDAKCLIELCRIIFNSVLIYSKNCHNTMKKQEVVSLLKLALQYLNLPLENLSSHINYQNIKYSVTLFLTKFLIENCKELSAAEECSSLLNLLQENFGKKIEPYKLAIKYNQTQQTGNNDQAIEEIIMRMITTLNIILHWEQILECIGQLSKSNTKLAIVCMEYIFLNKLNQKEHSKIWEDLIVARVFLTIEAQDLTIKDITLSLNEFFKTVETNAVEKLSRMKISCIVTILWNLAKKLDKKQEYANSCLIYELAIKKLFCDDFSEIGKILRALISSYINCRNYEAALQQYERMEECDKLHPLTQLLLVKICYQFAEKNKITECLKNIYLSKSDNSIQILILAISFCKKMDDIVLTGINFLFEKIDLEEENTNRDQVNDWTIPLLELLRYTLQLIIKLFDSDNLNWKQNVPILQKLLTKAKYFIVDNSKLKKSFEETTKTHFEKEIISVDEVEWFASVAYNISVKGYNENKIDLIQPLISLAAELNDLIPINQFSFIKRFHFQYWKYRISLLKAIIFLEGNHNTDLDLSRSQELTLSLENVLEDISAFRKTAEVEEKIDKESIADLDNCYIELLTVQFKCILSLKNQQKLQIFTEKILKENNLHIDKVLIELCLSNPDCPQGMTKKTVAAIIKRSLVENTVSNNDLSTWIKILLENISNPGDITDESIISNVLNKFQIDIRDNPSCLLQSKENIETIATLIWNVGVNLLIFGDQENAIKWCKYSVLFAKFVNNDLKDQLKSMWHSLISSANIQDDPISQI